MKKFITLLLPVVALSFGNKVFAQSYHGFNTANYAGVVGSTIHPAAIEDYPGKFDMAFLGVNAFGDNNYGRATRSNPFFNFSFADFDGSLIRDNKIKYGVVNNEVLLFAFMFKTKKLGTIGFIPRLRTYANADNISPEFANALADGFGNSELFDINFINQNFDFTAMSWQEYGITWAKVLKETKHKKFTIGATPKILIGNASTFARFHTDDLTNVGLEEISVSGLEMEYGYSSNLDNVGNDFKWEKGNKFNFGLDIGVEYTHYEKSSFNPAFTKYLKLYRNNKALQHNYKYKVSLSLTDLGRIKYTHGSSNASANATLNGVNILNINSVKGTFDDPDALRDSLENLVVLEPTVGTYTVGLPTMFQAGIDYHLKGKAYINGNLGINMQKIKLSDYEVHDLTNLTITPRWENRWLGVYAPLYSNLKGTTNLGLGARIGPVAFGVSDILPFLTRKEVTSGGAYIVFKTFIRNKKEKSNTECGRGGVWNK